ncbi:MAG: hypothetical protein KAR38_10450, partial [Calditrichia bacterium]|nr:hypothetical protein [Calditrichia bacterium]
EAQLANLVSQKLTDSQKGLPKLETIISTKLKKRYIKKLFKKSSKNYDKIIKLLNDTGSWKQASLIIDNKFYELGINPYSKEAIEFSDLVYNRYFAKDKEKNAEDFE